MANTTEKMLEIITVKEFEGYDILGYYCRGHVSSSDFLEGLMGYGLSCEPNAAIHQYQRNVPVAGERGVMCSHPCNGPSKGAYPITWVDAENCWEVV